MLQIITKNLQLIPKQKKNNRVEKHSPRKSGDLRNSTFYQKIVKTTIIHRQVCSQLHHVHDAMT